MTDHEPNDKLAGATGLYRINGLRSNFRHLLKRERLIVSIALGLIVIFSVFDYFEDRAAGATPEALFSDVTDTFLPLLLLVYIWRFTPLFQRERSHKLEMDLARKNADLQHWKTAASNYIKGLSESIDAQFSLWNLTRAEKEVALLLLKGFSLRELAEVRGTSERTVRQQASRIYDKAGLRGRAELSAFFLEDLMLPTVE